MNAKTAIIGAFLALAASPALALGDDIEVRNWRPATSTIQTRYTRFGTNIGAGTVIVLPGLGSLTLGSNSAVHTRQGATEFAAANFNAWGIPDLTNPGAFSGWTRIATTPASRGAFSQFEAGGNVFLDVQGSIVTATNSAKIGAPASVEGIGLVGLMALTLVAATRKAFVLPSFFL